MAPKTQDIVDQLTRRLAHLERIAEGRSTPKPLKKQELVYIWQPSGPSCQGPILLMQKTGIKFESRPLSVDEKGKYPGRYDPSNLSLNYTGTLPTLQDKAAGMGVFESATIMRYLAEKFLTNSQWFPDDLATRTRINSYLDWQAYTLRSAFIVVGAALEAGHKADGSGIDESKAHLSLVQKQLYGYSNPIWKDRGDNGVVSQLQIINDKWLSQGPFIAGARPSIADLALYGDSGYIIHMFGMDFAKYPVLNAWYQRMEKEFGSLSGRKEYIMWMEAMSAKVKPLMKKQ